MANSLALASLVCAGFLGVIASAETRLATKVFWTTPEGDNLSWMEAQEFCNLNGTAGSRLASLETEGEWRAALRYASQQGIGAFWLSATDFGSEGDFHWVRSSGRVQDSVDQDGGRAENCLAARAAGRQVRITDEPCAGHAMQGVWALCEAFGDEQPGEPFECSAEGKFPDPEHCDKFHECVPYQGGFIDHEFTCPEFTNYCADREECGHPEDCPCTVPQRGRVSASSQSAPESRVTIAVSQDEQLDYVGRVGHKEFHTFRPRAPYFNWIQCMEFCHRHGMMLARMETDAERSLLVGYLTSLGSDYYYFWLSAVDYGSEGEYYWFGQGDKVDRAIYGNGGRDSNCLYLASTGPVYDWTCERHSWARTYPLCQRELEQHN